MSSLAQLQVVVTIMQEKCVDFWGFDLISFFLFLWLLLIFKPLATSKGRVAKGGGRGGTGDISHSPTRRFVSTLSSSPASKPIHQ